MKIPYMLIVGGREQEAHSVAVRSRKHGDLGQIAVLDFATRILDETAEKK